MNQLSDSIANNKLSEKNLDQVAGGMQLPELSPKMKKALGIAVLAVAATGTAIGGKML